MHFIRQRFGEQAASVFAAMVVNNTPLWLQVEFSQSSTGPSAERQEYQSTGSSCKKNFTFANYQLWLFLQICISACRTGLLISPDWHNSSLSN